MSDLFALNSKKCLIDISEKILESSIIPIPTTLSDGSVIVYDRGEQYGEYNLTDGVLTRISEGEDSESYDDINWRYLIADIENTVSNNYTDYADSTGGSTLTQKDIGYGLSYTDYMIENCLNSASNDIFSSASLKRIATNQEWFVPTINEALTFTIITNQINPSAIWTCNSFQSSDNFKAYVLTLKGSGAPYYSEIDKRSSYSCIFMRRV